MTNQFNNFEHWPFILVKVDAERIFFRSLLYNLFVVESLQQVHWSSDLYTEISWYTRWVFFKKMGQPRPLFIVYFQSFQTNIIRIFTTNICEKSSSSIGLGFEPTTLEHESPPITTRPGLPPLQDEFRYPDECTEMSIQVIIRCQVNFWSLPMRPFFGHSLTWLRISWQRTFTVRGRITVRLVSSYTRLGLTK